MDRIYRTNRINERIHIVLKNLFLLPLAFFAVFAMCSCSAEKSAISKPVTAKTAPDITNTIEGKWYGYWENHWEEAAELLIKITGTEENRYRITVYESTEEYAPAALEIVCKLTDGTILVFDSGEMIDGGKGVIDGTLLTGEFEGAESGKFELHKLNEKATVNPAGKWQGHWINDWGQREPVSVNVIEKDKGQYRFELVESFDPGAETLVSLDARVDHSGRISFSGDSDIWTGSGKGFCGNEACGGTFEGSEDGQYLLRRVK